MLLKARVDFAFVAGRLKVKCLFLAPEAAAAALDEAVVTAGVVFVEELGDELPVVDFRGFAVATLLSSGAPSTA